MSDLPVDVFIGYSHADELLKNAFLAHLSALERSGHIRVWHDRKMTGGEPLDGTIDSHLMTAGVVVLLVSSDWIHSDYCYKNEMIPAMERRGRGECEVVPVITRPCAWEHLPIGQLVAVPQDGKPVTNHAHQDDAWRQCTLAIKAAAHRTKLPAQPPESQTSRGDKSNDKHKAISELVHDDHATADLFDRVFTNTLPVQFHENSLQDVLTFIGGWSRSGVDVDWESLDRIGIAKETSVSLQSRSWLGAEVLRQLMHSISDRDLLAEWEIDGGVIRVAAKDDLNRYCRTVTLPIPPDFTQMFSDQEWAGIVLDLVASSIEPDSWDIVGGTTGKIFVSWPSLVVMHRPMVLRRIASLLRDLG